MKHKIKKKRISSFNYRKEYPRRYKRDKFSRLAVLPVKLSICITKYSETFLKGHLAPSIKEKLSI